MKEKNALLVDFGRREFPANWDEYELIDSGGFEKLERFGINPWMRNNGFSWHRLRLHEEWEEILKKEVGN